jgi:hypothetical protein
MKSAFSIVIASLRDTWLDLWSALVCNIVWLFACILIIPGPPTTMALFYYANQSVRGEAIYVTDFFKAIPRFWKTGWRWGLMNLIVLAILAGDIYLTNSENLSPAGLFFRSLYFTLAAFWFLSQVFALPFLLEQEKPAVFQALRNSLVMIGKNPIFSLSLLIFLLLILILGVVVFMLSIALGSVYVAFVGNRAVLSQIQIE